MDDDKISRAEAIVYRLKGSIRWILYHSRIGVSYHPYDNAETMADYHGYYEHFGRCIVFRKVDGGREFVW